MSLKDNCYFKLVKLMRRLDVVEGFNRDRNLIPLTVAAHSFHVASMTYLVCTELVELGRTVCEERAVRLALLHDLGEAVTGDIIRPT